MKKEIVAISDLKEWKSKLAYAKSKKSIYQRKYRDWDMLEGVAKYHLKLLGVEFDSMGKMKK
jgi:hypothetical protein